MLVTKRDLYKMIDRLSESDTASVFAYLQFLITRSALKRSKIWDEIAQLPTDEEPLNEEEFRQMAAPGDYISLKQVVKEYGI